MRFFRASADPNPFLMRCLHRGPPLSRVPRSELTGSVSLEPLLNIAQFAAGTSQDDGTPAENPSDTSMAAVHLGPRFWARPLFLSEQWSLHRGAHWIHGLRRMSAEWIGWASSAILLATLIRQVYSQWKQHSVAGVSRWLFVGQLTASTGFLIYSVLVDNWVFVFTNAALLLTAVVGQVIYWRNARSKSG